ncbi:MAG: Gfo/Idh/MocA family oxidoreductase [Opitutus sp.]|nr:Gfo/Idh/MocA family oxidoreductase [Opitutus sp.]
MISRRSFLKNSTSAAVGGLVASTAISHAASSAGGASSRVLKVGLIGCGGRGTGAAQQALAADPNNRLVAIGDAFADRAASCLSQLRRVAAAKIDVTPATTFTGLDAYQKVIDSGVDVVLLCTPPGFRPVHLQAAIAADKHVFCEKPMAVDAPGVRAVLAIAAEAKRKNLALGSGFCWRYDDMMRASVAQIREGAIGDIRAINASYHTNSLTTKFPGTREPGWTDLQWQMRNWYNFTWLSGDHLVEQAVHNVNKIAWYMQDEMPAQVIGTGGRDVAAYGNTYDHFSITYEYASGVRAVLGCRQVDGAYNEVSDHVVGTKGIFSWGRGPSAHITGAKTWRYTGKGGSSMYQVEHNELFASIRAGNPINDGVWMAHSTLMAIMGRMAAYTGQAVTWDQAMNSKDSLVPEKFDWNMALSVPARAVPGLTKFV